MTEPNPSSRDTWGFPVQHPEPGQKATFLTYLRSRFVTGALVAFPLAVTIFFGRFLFGLLDRWSYPISQKLVGYPIPGAGALLAVLLVFALGMLAHNVLGRRILRVGERLISRVPVIRPIYTGAREITRAFGADRTKAFRRVVLIPFPTQGVWSIGFLTNEFDADTGAGSQRMISVFMPTTPNPTTGFYMLLPAAMAIESHLTVEEAVRLVISGGLLSPDPGRFFALPASDPGQPTP
jgi:uncharacterized membrane protein